MAANGPGDPYGPYPCMCRTLLPETGPERATASWPGAWGDNAVAMPRRLLDVLRLTDAFDVAYKALALAVDWRRREFSMEGANVTSPEARCWSLYWWWRDCFCCSLLLLLFATLTTSSAPSGCSSSCCGQDASSSASCTAAAKAQAAAGLGKAIRNESPAKAKAVTWSVRRVQVSAAGNNTRHHN